MSATPICQHIKADGLRCGSPALRSRAFCFFHQSARDRMARAASGRLRLPILEDAQSVQVALMDVAHAIALNRLDTKRAGLLLYALQTATINLHGQDRARFDWVGHRDKYAQELTPAVAAEAALEQEPVAQQTAEAQNEAQAEVQAAEAQAEVQAEAQAEVSAASPGVRIPAIDASAHRFGWRPAANDPRPAVAGGPRPAPDGRRLRASTRFVTLN